MARYINPYTDFGFKKLFGEEANKDLLIDFLNQLLPSHHQIVDLNFRNVEILPELAIDRKAIFDIHCQASNGERFIVEMQKAKINFFKDRSLFYASFPIREQAKRGIWDFKLTPIYMIAVLDFQYDEDEERKKFLRSVNLKDQDGDLFYDKLHFKFIQMPLFQKQEHELENHFDKWIYFLKNLETFDEIPQILKEPIFEKAFTVAEIANMGNEQYDKYLESFMVYIEDREFVKTAQEDGLKKGMKEGIRLGMEKGMEKGIKEGEKNIAKKMKLKGLTNDEIADMTNLTADEINEL